MSTSRRQSLITPREHGAWGILLIPLATGAAVGLLGGHSGWGLAPLTVAVLALFWLRTPVESWMGTTPIKATTAAEFQLVRRTCLALALVSGLALAGLFWGGRNLGLLWIGAIAAAAFVGQARVRQVWRKARAASQFIGAAGLTAVAPAAYYVVVGRLDQTAWALWALNLLFASNQIEYVQLRIRSARAFTRAEKFRLGAGFLVGQGLEVVLLAAGCCAGIFPWYVAAAFLPLLVRGMVWFAVPFQPLAVRTLGKQELAHGIAFGLFVIVGIALA